MERLTRFLLTVLLLGGVVFALMGAGETTGPVILLVPVVCIAAGVALFHRPAAGLELGWAGRSASPDGATLVAGGAFTPSPPAESQRPRAGRRQVAAALARVEAREWLSSPWFAAGAAFCILETLLFGWAWSVDFEAPWREWFVLFPIMAHPLVGMAVVGSHQAVTRARRDGAEELFEACPADEAIRTAAHLRAAWVPAVLGVVTIIVGSVLLGARSDRLYGPIDARAVADSLTAIVLTLCGVWLGVALARWAPWRLVPVVSVATLLPVIIALGNLGDPHWSNARQLSTWPRYPDHDLLFTAPPVWWHLLWLAALGGLMGVVALVHARRDRRVLQAGVAVAVLAIVAGIAQTRPVSPSDATRLASLVAEPERHQTCRSAPGVEICAYRGYEGYLDDAIGHAAPVAAAAPRSGPPLTLRQAFDGEVEVLGPEVRRALDGLPPRSGGYLPIGFSTSDPAMDAVRLTVALASVGLPVEPEAGDLPLVVAGQARGVVALWLGARGLGPGAATKLASHRLDPHDTPDGEAPTAIDLGSAWPDPCGAGPAPVAWARQDLAAARALLSRPVGEVHRLLVFDWDRFTDPATGTDELLAAAGLDPVGPPDHIVAEPVECSY